MGHFKQLLQDFPYYSLSKAGQSITTPDNRMKYGFKAYRLCQEFNVLKESARSRISESEPD